MKIVNNKRNILTLQDRDYFIDIVKNKSLCEVWLYKDNIGIKMFCFGVFEENFAMSLLSNMEQEYEIYEDLYVKGER